MKLVPIDAYFPQKRIREIRKLDPELAKYEMPCDYWLKKTYLKKIFFYWDSFKNFGHYR